MIYGKPCHLPVKLAHKVYWAVNFLNFDLKAIGEKRLLQLNELEEIHSDVYKGLRVIRRDEKVA